MSSTNETFNPNLSLFIPRVDTRSLPVCKEDEADQDYETRVKSFIAEQFHNYNIGSVDRVDLITKMTPEGYPFYIAFIHFAEWYNNFQAKGLQKAVFNKTAKMYLTQRSYWILCENKKPLTQSEVEMKTIIYKQEQELATLKKEVEALKMYEQASPEAKLYASYMQDLQVETARKLFDTPVHTPEPVVCFDRPPPLKRSVAYEVPKASSFVPITGKLQWGDDEEEEGPPHPLTRSISERPPPLTRCISEVIEAEEMPPPLLTRCNTEAIEEEGMPRHLIRCIEEVIEEEEEEEMPPPPPPLTRCITEVHPREVEEMPPPPLLTRCNAEAIEEEEMPGWGVRSTRNITELLPHEEEWAFSRRTLKKRR